MIRNYGVKGLQKHIREGVRLAQKFEALVLADQRFEIPATRHLGNFLNFFYKVPAQKKLKKENFPRQPSRILF